MGEHVSAELVSNSARFSQLGSWKKRLDRESSNARQVEKQSQFWFGLRRVICICPISIVCEGRSMEPNLSVGEDRVLVFPSPSLTEATWCNSGTWSPASVRQGGQLAGSLAGPTGSCSVDIILFGSGCDLKMN